MTDPDQTIKAISESTTTHKARKVRETIMSNVVVETKAIHLVVHITNSSEAAATPEAEAEETTAQEALLRNQAWLSRQLNQARLAP